jgi:hypothetical protein
LDGATHVTVTDVELAAVASIPVGGPGTVSALIVVPATGALNAPQPLVLCAATLNQ